MGRRHQILFRFCKSKTDFDVTSSGANEASMTKMKVPIVISALENLFFYRKPPHKLLLSISEESRQNEETHSSPCQSLILHPLAVLLTGAPSESSWARTWRAAGSKRPPDSCRHGGGSSGPELNEENSDSPADAPLLVVIDTLDSETLMGARIPYLGTEEGSDGLCQNEGLVDEADQWTLAVEMEG
ncbi:hypothetical protein PRIPAC_83477 [Pristionchus pacificus]|uniref:Uncharacterized protein n=1 Tax=Pristionchus pacificus TaxID=54126 RepID=A0A2A6BT46_PRIPA|nr:hypothetical protein PRIPAC_83477 [Pristionchus pacificus]|eukprot:PDM69142.1 hypothetical protein PRIPAC_47444 [Pristionchus pacificus]